MKNKVFFGFIVLLIACLSVSCNGDVNSVEESAHLIVISDVSSIGDSGKGLEIGDPIIGVLLKFHREGLYSRNSKVKLDNPFAFYLEMLPSEGTNGDGMRFNYVLYVPDCIQDVYTLCGGINPRSGNPFWWYMLTYYGKSLSDIRGDWEKTLNLLLDERNWLFFPKEIDFVPSWSQGSTQGSKSVNLISQFEDLDKPVIGFMVTSSSVQEVNTKANPYSFYGYYLDEPKTWTRDGQDYEYNFVLYIPASIKQAYVEGGGIGSDTGNPFWWYLRTYYGYELLDVFGKPEEILAKLLLGEADMAKYPNSDDVKSNSQANKSVELVSDYNELNEEVIGFMITSKNVQELNPEANSKAFYGYFLNEPAIWHKGKSDEAKYNFVLYIPNSIKEAYACGNGKDPDTGNPFWWYLDIYYGYKLHDVFEKPYEILEKLLAGEGDMTILPESTDVTGKWVSE